MDPDRNKEFVDKLLALYGENGKWGTKPGEYNDERLCEIGCFFMSYNLQNFNPSKPETSKAMLAAEASSKTLEWQFFATFATTEWIDSGDKPESSLRSYGTQRAGQKHTPSHRVLYSNTSTIGLKGTGYRKTNGTAKLTSSEKVSSQTCRHSRR